MKSKILIIIFYSISVLGQSQLILNLELGKSYEMFNHNEIIMTQNINNDEIRTYSEIDGKTVYKVIEKTDSTMKLEVTMNDFIFMMSSPYFRFYLDSNEPNNSNNILAKIITLLKDLKFHIILNKKGQISSNNFTKIFSSKFSKFLDTITEKVDTSKLNELRAKMEQMSPEKNFERLTLFFPQKSVTVGESWTINGNSTFGIPLTYNRIVKFVSKGNNAIHLESNSSLNSLEVNKSKLMFDNINYELTGTEQHHLIINENSGWFEKVEGTIDLSGFTKIILEHGDTLKAPTKMFTKEYYGTVKY